MRTRQLSLLGSLLAALALTLAATPAAHAERSPLTFQFQRASNLDSALVTLSGANQTIDTTGSIQTEGLNATVLAALDTSSGVFGPEAVHAALAVIVEVTGTMASTDSLFLAYDVSEDVRPWPDTSARWYTGISTFLAAVENNTATQTFVFLLPADPANVNSWIWHRQIRFRLRADGNTSSRCFSTRASYAWRVR